jgi:hypothetical protein
MKAYKLILLILLLAGCATQPQGPSYEEKLATLPLPKTDEERIKECTTIRSEIARFQNIAMAAPALGLDTLHTAMARAESNSRIAALEDRASRVGCNAAFQTAPAPAPGKDFDACFERCQKLTDRTKNQCFDACNK